MKAPSSELQNPANNGVYMLRVSLSDNKNTFVSNNEIFMLKISMNQSLNETERNNDN